MLCCAQDPYATRLKATQLEKERINRQIEKELSKHKKRFNRQHRCLLLGCGEAGKTTFIKQMRIIHSEGFNDQERVRYQQNIADNIVSAINSLLENLTFVEEKQVAESPELRAALEKIPDPKRDKVTPQVVLSLADDITTLWKSDEVQAAFSRRNQFQLVECARYFLSQVHVVMADGYVPTDQDILQTRIQTEGIIEHSFEMKNDRSKRGKRDHTIVLIDVAGQRGERSKWMHCFDNILMLIFLTAISEYDQVLAEDKRTNRMKESINLFGNILELGYFQRTSVLLFLNKVDLLEEKVCSGKSPVKNYFPEYEGSESSVEDIAKFFEDSFLAKNLNPDRKIFSRVTCATDTENIKVVDVLVQQKIMEEIFRGIGIS